MSFQSIDFHARSNIDHVDHYQSLKIENHLSISMSKHTNRSRHSLIDETTYIQMQDIMHHRMIEWTLTDRLCTIGTD